MAHHISLTPAQLREQFDLDGERGFLPTSDPLIAPGANATPGQVLLTEISAQLPKRLLTGTLRRTIDALPVNALDLGDLVDAPTSPELRLAMAQLSFIAHGYMWSQDEPAQILPAVLAGPWRRAADALGRPPILSYGSYCLDNWRRMDADRPIELDNVALIHNFLAGVDEDWFVTIHVCIEHAAAPALTAAIGAAEESARPIPSIDVIRDHLNVIGDAMDAINAVFDRMPERCDPYIYYHRVRPFIFGTKDNPDLPNGLIYEGEYDNNPQFFRGETGAQSGIIPAIDALFGVMHAKDDLREYLAEMRTYMPPQHRAFVEYLETTSQVRRRVQDAEGLASAYDRCLEGVRAFRARHVEYASRYIHAQSQIHSLIGTGGSTERGTGGTPFMPYLKKHRDETEKHKVRTPGENA